MQGMDSPRAPGGSPPVTPDDSQLLRQIHHGDEQAMRELIARHGSYLYGVARALTGNDHDADDVVQEVFAALLKARFRGESSVRTWLVGILVNRVATLRRAKSRMAFPLPEIDLPAGDSAAEPPARSDARLDLAEMLQSLSPDHREVIVLRELQGMSYEQMALLLSVPRGTVESRLHRAREQLRTRFRNYFE
jgi:RNA polymerase sigma-70 factor (ECF subfamily)